MLMARYLWLCLLYHFTSFFRIWPWAFVWGLVTWPVHFVRWQLVQNENKRLCVAYGARTMLEHDNTGYLVPMPGFVRRKFERIYEEARS